MTKMNNQKVNKILSLNKILGFFTFLIITASCGCSNDKNTDSDPNNGFWTIPQEVKDYIFFKPGSYWIYQDSSTGIIDSVFLELYNYGIDTSFDGNNIDGFFEYCFNNLHHSYDGKVDVYWVNGGWLKMYGYTPVWHDKFYPGHFIGETYLFGHPFIEDKIYSPYTALGRIKLSKIFSNYSNSQVSYSNVLEFYNDSNITADFSKTNTFIAKNIGIIRKEVIDSGQVWNLIRHQVIQ